jgi:hypothetical protein
MESPVPSPGLPPVTPPSGRFLMQLFLVPTLIVTVILAIIFGLGYLVSGPRTPEHFLRDLDSSNADIRWRGAHDLAQVLNRPESLALASDPKFALDLAERLHRALAELEATEKATAERVKGLPPDEQQAAWRGLSAQRNLVFFLAGSLGDFTVPVGVPVLSELALHDRGPDVKGTTIRRRKAVWALGNLGEKFKRRYQGTGAQPGEKVLTEPEKAAIVEQLRAEAAGSTDRARWAENALSYLNPPPTGDSYKPRRWVAVDKTLADCARAEDPYLRSQVGLVLNFWEGELVEPTLQRLARDDGHGPRIELGEND